MADDLIRSQWDALNQINSLYPTKITLISKHLPISNRLSFVDFCCYRHLFSLLLVVCLFLLICIFRMINHFVKHLQKIKQATL